MPAPIKVDCIRKEKRRSSCRFPLSTRLRSSPNEASEKKKTDRSWKRPVQSPRTAGQNRATQRERENFRTVFIDRYQLKNKNLSGNGESTYIGWEYPVMMASFYSERVSLGNPEVVVLLLTDSVRYSSIGFRLVRSVSFKSIFFLVLVC